MDDNLIRRALIRRLARHFSRDPHTFFIEELGLRHGAARIDIAVVNGVLHGYEIKSDRDTLRRLPEQIRIYNSVLDRVTLVVGLKHFDESVIIIPDWWGVLLAEPTVRGGIRFAKQRDAQDNPAPDILGLAKLFWRDEALALLEEIGAADGFRSKSRSLIYQRLVESVEPDLLRSKLRLQLAVRADQRAV